MEKLQNTGRELCSESGTFIIDKNGIVQRFEPAGDNLFVEEETEFDNNYNYTTRKSIRTMVIPNEVRGFVSDFMRGVRVIERFEFPEGLERIGNNSFDINKKEHCVFANCILPSVVIPRSVKEIGSFAFGHTQIESLQIPVNLQSPYGRQFKDSFIETLRLPHEWKDLVSLDKNNRLCFTDSLDTDFFGYLRWPSTLVERLEFY